MGARYYDPIGGRFLSTDPIGHPININLYTYANGDPINFNDPDGRFATKATETLKTTYINSDFFIDRRSIGGLIHGGSEFGIATIHDLEASMMHYGASDLSLEGRVHMFNELNTAQEHREKIFGNALTGLWSVDEHDPVYHSSRIATRVGLEVASLATGGYAIARGGYLAIKEGMHLAKLARTSKALPEFASTVYKEVFHTSHIEPSLSINVIASRMKGYTRHGLNQAIGRDYGRGVE